jgi:hypothetical protein
LINRVPLVRFNVTIIVEVVLIIGIAIGEFRVRAGGV